MAERLLENYGEDIRHTHNDLLDSIMVGGVAGLLWFGLWISWLIAKSLSLPLSTAEGAAAVAILAIYLCHSQLTGQLFGTDSMSAYVVTLACFYRIDGLRAERGLIRRRARRFGHSDLLLSRDPQALPAFE